MSWSEFSLGEVSDVRRGTTITQLQTRPGNVPVVAGGMSPTYFHDTSNRAGNVITVSASGASAGYVNFWTNPIFASDCSTVTTNRDDMDIKFVYHFLRSQQHYINSKLRSGAAQPHVYAKDIAQLRLQVPPINVQRRIAAILDQADTLKAKRQEALAELASLTQSIFIEMFGDVEGNGWSISSVADIAGACKGSIRTGPFGSQLLHSEFVDDGVVVLGIDNAVRNEFRWGERRFISPEKYQELKRYTVLPGDVLITIMGTCGRCAVVPADIPVAINTKHICCITLNAEKCLPSFLHSYFLMHPMARKYLAQTAKGAIMDGLNMGIIKAMPVPLVPMNLQHAFEARLGSLQKTKSANLEAAAELDSLFASLQHCAFRGEL